MNIIKRIRRWLRQSEPQQQQILSVKVTREEVSPLRQGRFVRGNALRPFQSRPVRGNGA